MKYWLSIIRWGFDFEITLFVFAIIFWLEKCLSTVNSINCMIKIDLKLFFIQVLPILIWKVSIFCPHLVVYFFVVNMSSFNHSQYLLEEMNADRKSTGKYCDVTVIVEGQGISSAQVCSRYAFRFLWQNVFYGNERTFYQWSSDQRRWAK